MALSAITISKKNESAVKSAVINNSAYRWCIQNAQNSNFYVRGRLAATFENIQAVGRIGIDALINLFRKEHDYASFIYEDSDLTIAYVDHIRNFQIFYLDVPVDGCAWLSNSAHDLAEAARLQEVDELSALEFALAGYATGEHTLYKGLKSVPPGHFLIRRNGARPELIRYFKYRPDLSASADGDVLRSDLAKIMDAIMDDVFERTKDRPVLLPLSGGLDSRILLAHMVKRGHKNIKTFTYGPRYNFEAGKARKVAEALNVPWQFVALSRRESRQIFESATRKEFWRYADGLKSVPCMREYAAIMKLKKDGVITPETVFLNGQSGDYITGGHINAAWEEAGNADKSLFLKVIRDKHYDLWQSLRTPDIEARVETRISDLVPEMTIKEQPRLRWGECEEMWEYEGRQVCYVVNGQRIYEFVGCEWEMPLWDKRLVEFYQKVSMTEKRGQTLYKNYLRSAFPALFPEEESYIWRWPLPMLWIVPIARLIGIFGGSKAKKDFYARMRYFGHYANQYEFFPFSLHTRTATNARNVISLHVLKWMQESPTFFSKRIREILYMSKY